MGLLKDIFQSRSDICASRVHAHTHNYFTAVSKGWNQGLNQIFALSRITAVFTTYTSRSSCFKNYLPSIPSVPDTVLGFSGHFYRASSCLFCTWWNQGPEKLSTLPGSWVLQLGSTFILQNLSSFESDSLASLYFILINPLPQFCLSHLSKLKIIPLLPSKSLFVLSLPSGISS